MVSMIIIAVCHVVLQKRGIFSLPCQAMLPSTTFSVCSREDAEAVMKLYRHMVVKKPTEAATHEEMVEVYLFLWSLQSEENKAAEREYLALTSGEAYNSHPTCLSALRP